MPGVQMTHLLQKQKNKAVSVFIADDNFAFCNDTAFMLSNHGWIVLGHECDSEAAISEATRLGAQIIIADIQFAGEKTDGFGIVSRLRRAAAHKGLRPQFAIFVTGHGAETDQEKLKTTPCSFFRAKPVHDDDLLELVAQSADQYLNKPLWCDEHNDVRCGLIDKKHAGGLTPEEERVLEKLQAMQLAWYYEVHGREDTSKVDAALAKAGITH